MLLDKKELDENELDKSELRRKCTRRNVIEPKFRIISPSNFKNKVLRATPGA